MGPSAQRCWTSLYVLLVAAANYLDLTRGKSLRLSDSSSDTLFITEITARAVVFELRT
jgi:hypothetical protein